MVLRFVYTVFVGILLALFVGLGVAAFYPAPQYPETPVPYEKIAPNGTPENTAEAQRIAAENEKAQREYEAKMAVYTSNLFIVTVVFSLLFLSAGLLFAERIAAIADGLVLGGVFTLVYGIARGMQNQDAKFRFLTVAIGLMVALALGYIKFIRPLESKLKKS